MLFIINTHYVTIPERPASYKIFITTTLTARTETNGCNQRYSTMIINRLLHVLNGEGLYQTCYHVTFAINNHDVENNASLKY